MGIHMWITDVRTRAPPGGVCRTSRGSVDADRDPHQNNSTHCFGLGEINLGGLSQDPPDQCPVKKHFLNPHSPAPAKACLRELGAPAHHHSLWTPENSSNRRLDPRSGGRGVGEDTQPPRGPGNRLYCTGATSRCGPKRAEAPCGAVAQRKETVVSKGITLILKLWK